jgi:HK97 gp10 family phage protein
VAVEIIVIRNDFPRIAGAVPGRVRDAVHATGFRIEGLAKQKAPVDTGYMRNNITNEPGGDASTTIDSRALYSLFQERGTRFMRAQPFFTPAVEEGKTILKTLVTEAIEGAT